MSGVTRRNTTWVQVDVRFPRHRKVVQLERDLRYRFIEALCHCREHNTGGEISEGEALELMRDLRPAKARQAAEALVAAGLWDRSEGGYRIHDWDEWNGSLDRTRKGNAERQKAKRERDAVVTDA